ncbi:hypothetical protein [Dipodfec virus UOA04_Rod_1209]|nr:hypothetical protein [Dipodfec virus UOA04_Rod_1209]
MIEFLLLLSSLFAFLLSFVILVFELIIPILVIYLLYKIIRKLC